MSEAPTAAGLQAALRPMLAEVAPKVTASQSVATAYEQYHEALRARGYAHDETLRQHIVARTAHKLQGASQDAT